MNATESRQRLLRALTLAIVMAAAVLLPAAALAAPPAAPAWRLGVTSMPSNFTPGADGDPNVGPRYDIIATNVGEAAAPEPIEVVDTLPAGLTPGALELSKDCSASGQVVSCTIAQTIYPGERFHLAFGVNVAALADPTALEPNEVTISSPGAVPRTATTATTVTAERASFGFDGGQAGLGAWLTEADGTPTVAAGSRPSQLTVNVGFRTRPGGSNTGSVTVLPAGGRARAVRTVLPPGLIFDPSATPVRCTEAQFVTATCPDAAAVGRANVAFNLAGSVGVSNDPIYNLVPAPGSAATFALEPTAIGVRVHLLGGLRPGDYAATTAIEDLPALFNYPLYGAQLQFWGDPSSASHDHLRGACAGGSTCPVPPRDVAALSAPTSCGSSLALETEIDSWEGPGKWITRRAPFSDLEGNPADTVSGCNAVPFNPSLSAQPTTNLADSPSGLDVDLRIPQSTGLASAATAHLKQAVVTLPEGLVVNLAGANRHEVCGPAQIGIDPTSGVADGEVARCPDAAKIGSVEVESPLLAQYDSAQKVQRDPEGHVIAEPISGSVYLATPHENPFNSLLAIYIALDDPAHGIVVKLAGKVSADPSTGRLTTTFADNPQLPFEHLRLHFFDGAGAVLRTPLSCGTKTTASDLTPWSAPEGADAAPSDSFQITAEPGGGPCPSSEAQAANHPAFSAGTIAPRAGAYSPLVLRLSREDGTAPITGIDTTLPAGLTGKLAGIAYCPDAALAAAAAKSGSFEKQSPSCPASSEVGSVTVGVGAGPTPYYIQGHAYLAGPYKSAPLSLATITPATAGPYDLGAIVVHTALNVDPETARIHAVSDPIPQILQGVPLDVRSIALKMDRPNFTLNPTSCDPMALIGSAATPSGPSAALSSPFQVGGCSALPFKPKLSLELSGGTKRGSHPALKAVFTAEPGEANIADAATVLPDSEFLDQSHIKAICTRVKFAADQCPAGSIYGEATVITPLLDKPLSGPVYLRSSAHTLPDLVADLDGQIHVVLVGRIDSVRGGIRNTFEAIPDVPVSRFVFSMRGGKKGLLVNGRNLCRSASKASAQMDGQNGRAYDTTLALRTGCSAGKGARSHSRH